MATTLTYTVSQAAGATNTAPGPIVNPNGIVNAASFISANLPAGSIAQGSFFSIFGNGLGPDNPGLQRQQLSAEREPGRREREGGAGFDIGVCRPVVCGAIPDQRGDAFQHPDRNGAGDSEL